MAIFKIENYVRFVERNDEYDIFRKKDEVWIGYLCKKDGQWGVVFNNNHWVDWGTSHDVFMQLVILNNMERLNQEEK
jgi:hypothetical protein